MAAANDHGFEGRSFRTSSHPNSVLTQEGVTLIVSKGCIAEQEVDAVVTSVSLSHDLKQGALSKVLLERAGQELQNEMTAARSKDLQYGNVKVAKGFNLSTSFVFYGVLKQWNKGLDDAEQVFRTFVQNSLIKGNEMKLESIAIPAMGTGVLGFTSDQVADYFFSEADRFSSTNPGTNLKEIRFVVYDKDQKTVNAFQHKLKQLQPKKQETNDAVKKDFDSSDEDEGHKTNIFEDLRGLPDQETLLNVTSKSLGAAYPSTWKQTTPGKQYETTVLDETDPEFKMVSERIMKTMGKAPIQNILKIERIENRTLYQLYAVYQDEVEKRNGLAIENERILWHGTARDYITNICSRGFARGYRGNNAVGYGKGVYFARDFEYSADSTCSPPDSNGTKYVFMCAVLTGTFAAGNDGVVVPEVNPVTGFPHNSTVDDLASPKIFVVYKDAQAYPQYLVSFN